MSLLLVLRYESSPFIFHVSHISSDSESEEWNHLSPQFDVRDSDRVSYNVMCSVNGLFCVSCTSCDMEFEEFVFWKPSTDEFKFIPHPDSRYLPCPCSSRQCITCILTNACGLGFVAESQDYRFVTFMTNNNEIECREHFVTEHVAVYSSKNDSWKEVPFPFKFYEGEGDLCPKRGAVATCVGGFCYWITRRDAILSFDLSSDKFSTLPYPDDIERDDFCFEEDVFLIELDGALCLVIQFQLEEPETTTKLFCFWVYESSPISIWTRKFNLDVRVAAFSPLTLVAGQEEQ